MLHAVARDAPSADLPSLGHELAQHHHVLVVDVVDPVFAEDADRPLGLLPGGLVVLLSRRAPRARLRFTRHPAVSPLGRSFRRREPRPSCPSRWSSTWRSMGTGARPSRSSTSGS